MCEDLLRRIAKEGNVTKSTAIKMLNNACSFDVSKKHRIIDIADEYGYKITKRSMDGSIEIGVAMPIIPSYFWSRASCAINDFVNASKYPVSVVYSYYSDFTNKRDVQYCLNYLHRQELDAYIIVPDESGYAAEILKEFKKPFGLLNRNYNIDNKLCFMLVLTILKRVKSKEKLQSFF